MKKIGWVGIWVALLWLATGARAEVDVTNLVVTQRPGTKLADISYDVSNTEARDVWVSLAVNNAGTPVVVTNLTGAIGHVVPGTGKAMAWDMGADWNGNFAMLSFALTAVKLPLEGMVFVQGGSLPDIGNGVITVSNFYIGKYEVTKAQWDAVYVWAITNGYAFDNVGDGCATNHPVQSVNWYDVVKWCNAKSQKEGRTPAYTVSGSVYRSGQTNDVVVNADANGYRLPTDAQWEFAARGGTQSQGYTYSGGNDVGAVAWYDGNCGGAACDYSGYGKGTWPVGGKAANELGIYDMSGNVWEWCFDWCPGWEGSFRVYRSGSWLNDADICRVGRPYIAEAARVYGRPGFRVVLPPGRQ